MPDRSVSPASVISPTTLACGAGAAGFVFAAGCYGSPGQVAWNVLTAMGGFMAVVLAAAVQRGQVAESGRRVSDDIARLAAGDWQARVRLPAGSDLADVGFRLNLLAEQTAERFDALNRQAADLNALVDSLPDAVLLADAQRRAVRINEPAARFLGIGVPQAAGQPLIALLGEAAIVDAYEQAMAADDGDAGVRTPLVRELRVTRLGQRLTYQVAVVRTPADGVLVVLRDVTAAAEAVRMKTDFVANASHELRTPIAAIKIAFETLGDVVHDDPEQTARCLSIIGGHLRRLEEMLRDLLDLSRAEAADAAPDVGPVFPADLLASVNSAMGALAIDKGVSLTAETDESGAFVSDRKLLELVVKNLVENAIKYTPSGGTVTATIGRVEDNVRLTVADTGVGIPPQHTERVFERFYQVDPARSGSANGRGTGLGLAIVKHAVATLGGEISLVSTVGRGTTVTCVVPNLGSEDKADFIRLSCPID